MNSGSAAATVGNVDLPSARRTSSKLLFVILGALSLAATWNPTVSAVPYAADLHYCDTDGSSSDFVLHGRHCYWYSSETAKCSFQQAQTACSRLASSIASILTREEESFVLRMIKENTSVWIGLHDQQDSKASLFRWVDGERFQVDGGNLSSPSSYQRWREGEPSIHRHLDCVKMDWRGWMVSPGGCGAARLPFVCKRSAVDGSSRSLALGHTDTDHQTTTVYHYMWLAVPTLLLVASVSLVLLLVVVWRSRSQPHPQQAHSCCKTPYTSCVDIDDTTSVSLPFSPAPSSSSADVREPIHRKHLLIQSS